MSALEARPRRAVQGDDFRYLDGNHRARRRRLSCARTVPSGSSRPEGAGRCRRPPGRPRRRRARPGAVLRRRGVPDCRSTRVRPGTPDLLVMARVPGPRPASTSPNWPHPRNISLRSISSWPTAWPPARRAPSRTWRRRTSMSAPRHRGVVAHRGRGHGGTHDALSGPPIVAVPLAATGCSITSTTSCRPGGSASCKATSACTTCSSRTDGSPHWSTGRARPWTAGARAGRGVAGGDCVDDVGRFVDAYRAAGGKPEAANQLRWPSTACS